MNVTVIGAAILDIIAKSKEEIIPMDSNIGNVSFSFGGVGRNIAENLARLNANVKLIAALGDDVFGVRLLDSCERVGIDMSHCKVNKCALNSTYIAILDSDGEMNVAVVDDGSPLPIDHVKQYAEVIKQSSIIVLDTNFKEEDLVAYLDMFEGNDIYVDAISVKKAARIKDIVGRLHTIKMNKLEASFLADCVIDDEESIEKAAQYFLDKGTKRVVISLGQDGFYYRTKTESIRHKPRPIVPINATGAGDAMMAGIVYCSLCDKSADETVKFAQVMSELALMSKEAVSHEVYPQLVYKKMEEL